MPQPNAPTLPDERLDLYDEAVPWSVRERHLRRYVDAVCWVMERGVTFDLWADLGAGTFYGANIIEGISQATVVGFDRQWYSWTEHEQHVIDLTEGFPGPRRYDVISAIELLEHLPRDCWDRLLSDIAEKCEVFVGTCPIGHDGPNPKNPHHLFEPTWLTLHEMLSRHFKVKRIEFSHAVLTTGDEQAHAMFLCVP